MRFRRLAPALLGLAVGLGACEPDLGTSPNPSANGVQADATAAARLRVMSRNLYIGADVDRVIRALATPDPLDDLPALLGALAVLQATDLPTRIAAIAAEIARHRPHVVGLQEVYQLDVDLGPLGIPAPVVHQDFLALLEAALAARGLDYSVVAKVRNTAASPLPGVSLVDWDVLLVDRTRTEVGAVLATNNFQYNIGNVAPGVTILRGYIVAILWVGGRSYTVVNTHLESGRGAQLEQLRAAQALELATVLGTATPAVLLGDLNDVPGSPMHQVLRGAGLVDAWGSMHPGSEGWTCCHDEDLSNLKPDFDQRIDYVFARGTGQEGPRLQGRITRTGLQPFERLQGPFHTIWPSDHAGLVAELLTPRP